MAAGEDQPSHRLLRPEQTKVARDSLESVFSVEVNLNHLLPGGHNQSDAKKRYYLRTHKVDPKLSELTEEEEASAAAAEAKSKGKGQPSKATGKTAKRTKRPEDQDWRPQEPSKSKEEGKSRYCLRNRRGNPAVPEISEEDEEEAAQTAARTIGKESLDKDQASDKTGIKTSTRNDGTRHSTGFAVAKEGNALWILTCAHTIDEVYGEGHHDITAEEVNEYFSFEVHCSHQEQRIIRELNDKPIEEQQRQVTRAFVVAIDSQKDLMILKIADIHNIHLGYEDDDVCNDLHPALSMVGYDNLTQLEICILQGWPPQRISSLSAGQLSFPRRTYSAITQLNEKGYNMSLIEFTKLESDEGSSGAPTVNGKGNCVGVYHGIIGTKSYVISGDDVIQFLKKSGVVSTDHQGNRSGEMMDEGQAPVVSWVSRRRRSK